MAKPEPEYWYIELSVDHADRVYAVRRVGRAKDFPYTPAFYIQAQALDEIGAFHEAQKTLQRLGFRSGEVYTTTA
jgi:3-polyprenyl-4-hydroxybenzoate decarboxylase